MTKLEMREYLADLETRIDAILKKWKKIARIENGEVVQMEWQFEQVRIMLDVFWLDTDEAIELDCRSPRIRWDHRWKGLTQETATRVMDRIGNFAQIVLGRQNGRAAR